MSLSNTPNESLEDIHDSSQTITRRQLLVGLLSSVGAVGFSNQAVALDTLFAPNSAVAASTFYTPKEFALISRVADLIIPATDTKGALGVGVPLSMDRLYTEWANKDSKQAHKGQVKVLKTQLDKAAKGDFLALSKAQQIDALQNIDTAAFSDNADDFSAYRNIKNTIARFYYVSEEGATKELRYEPVPGRWESCIDLADVGRTWAV